MLSVTAKFANVKLKSGAIKQYVYYSFNTKSLIILNAIFPL